MITPKQISMYLRTKSISDFVNDGNKFRPAEEVLSLLYKVPSRVTSKGETVIVQENLVTQILRWKQQKINGANAQDVEKKVRRILFEYQLERSFDSARYSRSLSWFKKWDEVELGRIKGSVGYAENYQNLIQYYYPGVPDPKDLIRSIAIAGA